MARRRSPSACTGSADGLPWVGCPRVLDALVAARAFPWVERPFRCGIRSRLFRAHRHHRRVRHYVLQGPICPAVGLAALAGGPRAHDCTDLGRLVAVCLPHPTPQT